MSYMQLEIFSDDAFIIDTQDGIFVVPFSVAGRSLLNPGQTLTPEDENFGALKSALEMFIAGHAEWNEITAATGFVGRYSAYGYLDATDWMFDLDERDLRAVLTRVYGDET